jgi:cleavage and polyadenylation specificity factor subunit 1
LSLSDPHPRQVFLRSGHLAVYEALPAALEPPPEHPDARATFLSVRFAKQLACVFDITRGPEDGAGVSVLAEQRRISRQLIPFVSTPPGGKRVAGVFFTGDRPSWVLRTDKGGLRVHPSGHAVVHAFTACSLWGSKSEFLVYSDEARLSRLLSLGLDGKGLTRRFAQGPTLLEWMPGLEVSTALPSRFVPRGHAYSHIVFEPTSRLIVGAAALQGDFSAFDEDNNEVWAPEGVLFFSSLSNCLPCSPTHGADEWDIAPNVPYPKTDCSALELLTPEGWVAMDGYVRSLSRLGRRCSWARDRYDFASNECVNSMACVELETQSTDTGRKNYIAVGTTINRGEDLAVKGAVRCLSPCDHGPELTYFWSARRHTSLRSSRLCRTP